MPECKNDPKHSYKGDEPSPKGFGYCAHAENIGVIKNGKDGNKWIVKKIKNGSKRWIKLLIKEQEFVIFKVPLITYRQGKKHIQYSLLPGIIKNNKFYKWIKYNTFEKKESKVPKNVIKKHLTKTEIKNYYGNRKDINKKIKRHTDSKLYFISYSGKYDVPFIVYINENNAFIYKIPNKDKNTYELQDIQELQNINPGWKKWLKTIDGRYTELVVKYNYKRKFITDDSILLEINKNKYVLIWKDIIEFDTTGDEIKEFYAYVPGNYASPVSFSDKYLYFMEKYPIIKIPMKYFTNIKTKSDKERIYEYVYGLKNNEPLEKYSEKIKQKIIHHN
jgi:hypothetical protein